MRSRSLEVEGLTAYFIGIGMKHHGDAFADPPVEEDWGQYGDEELADFDEVSPDGAPDYLVAASRNGVHPCSAPFSYSIPAGWSR